MIKYTEMNIGRKTTEEMHTWISEIAEGKSNQEIFNRREAEMRNTA